MPRQPVALAAVAHPDDIEFMMAGTLLLLKQAGYAIHMWNLANGSCGTATQSKADIIRIRGAEAQASAALAGAVCHQPLFDDLAVFFDAPSLAATAAVVRQLAPEVILTHSPHDYMEDHQNVCRLVVTAAFARGMCNFATQPPVACVETPVALYHAMPHGLRDALGNVVRPHLLVDISSTMEQKKAMLAAHASQRDWLDHSQGMGAYIGEMERMSAEVARQAAGPAFAEGWLRHSHLGLCAEGFEPLKASLGRKVYEVAAAAS